jgi:hypothetical protein
MAISLCVLRAFARDSGTPAATRERQKRVSRQGAKLAKNQSNNRSIQKTSQVQRVSCTITEVCVEREFNRRR